MWNSAKWLQAFWCSIFWFAFTTTLCDRFFKVSKAPWIYATKFLREKRAEESHLSEMKFCLCHCFWLQQGRKPQVLKNLPGLVKPGSSPRNTIFKIICIIGKRKQNNPRQNFQKLCQKESVVKQLRFAKKSSNNHKFSSVQFSSSVVSDSLWPHQLQHARLPCLSQTPGVYSNSCLLSWWCHLAISSSVTPFSSCPQSLPASGSFPMSQLFAWGGQNTGVSASASVLPMNTQDWSPSGCTGWISLQSKGLSKVFSITTVQKH